MKFTPSHWTFGILLTARLLVLGSSGMFLDTTLVTRAQTIVSGPVVSGTWSPSGNPFIISGSVTVPAGQTLTIQPGVVVWIGSGVSITNNGLIQAVGTPTDRITFQPPVSSQFWGSILNNYSGTTNLFMFCDFQNAQTAISMYVDGNNYVDHVEIMNCTFSNCVSQAIFGQAYGDFTCCGIGGEPNAGTATISPMIENCLFNATSNGCVILIEGKTSSGCGCGGQQYGYSYPVLVNNLFENLVGTAFLAENGSNPGGGDPEFINNTIVSCGIGFSAQDPWDAQVEDNIFVGCTDAVVDKGTLSRTVQFNDFYGNATNFIGYGSTYGQWIIPNRNGTVADVLYNISQNPLFIAANNFQLQSTSFCVNAGEAGAAFANTCFPPSVGTNYDDMGAYGGPYACNWLTTVPKLPTHLSLTASNNLMMLSFEAIPRSTYQVKYIPTKFNATAGTNLWLTNSILTPASPPVSIVVSPYPPTNKQSYYQVRSLGRTPGN